MKHIKTRISYIKENHNNITTGHYLILEPKKNGLKISLTPEGVEYVNDINTEMVAGFEDMFDDIQANSEYIFHYNIGQSGFGLTDAEGITDGYMLNDDGEYEATDSTAKVYYYANYAVRNFIADFKDYGFTLFNIADN